MKEFGTTILRVVVGTIYVMHAYWALLVDGPTETAQFMANAAQLPAPSLMAWIVIVVHGVGGILIILGLWTRRAAALNAVIILVALLRVHVPQGFFLRDVIMGGTASPTGVAGYEFVLLLFAATVAVVLLGPGALAVKRRE